MERAGLSVRAFAQAAGYSHGSGVQRYIEPAFDGDLKPSVANKLADVLEGRGEPPIARAEILALTGMAGVYEVEPNKILPPKYVDLPRDVPVYSTALGTFAEDDVVEQTLMEMAEPLDYLLRPPGVANRQGLYGVYIRGESQAPRFHPGEIAFVDPKRPPVIGDDVVVYLRKQDGDDERVAAVLIKVLVRETATRIDLKQYNPPVEFSIDKKQVGAIHRVLNNADLYAGYR